MDHLILILIFFGALIIVFSYCMVKVVVEFRCLVKRLNDAEYQLTRLENWALKRSVVVAVKGEDGKITDYIFKDKPNPEDWEIDVPESR